MVAALAKREVYTYLCCPEPYPQLRYRLVFKRYPEFYIYYLILPCFFLSALSLLSFYLPPDCGEKLTLSITNLLALVVFQQIIAENMPPSGDDSPLIGKHNIIKKQNKTKQNKTKQNKTTTTKTGGYEIYAS